MANPEKSANNNSETNQGEEAKSAAQMDAIALLKADHRAVEKLFAEHQAAPTRSRKGKIFEKIASALKIHAALEETIFYPAVREQSDSDDKLDEAQVEHDTLKILIQDLENSPGDAFGEAKVKVLGEYVQHHVREEEGPGGILEQARKAGLDLAKLGAKMAQRKEELEGDPSQINAAPVSIGIGAASGGRARRSGGMSRMSREWNAHRREHDEEDERAMRSRRDDDGEGDELRRRQRGDSRSDSGSRMTGRSSPDDEYRFERGRGFYDASGGRDSYERDAGMRRRREDRDDQFDRPRRQAEPDRPERQMYRDSFYQNGRDARRERNDWHPDQRNFPRPSGRRW